MLEAWLNAIRAWLSAPAPTNDPDPLVAIILSETADLGPFPTTHGVIHKITPDMASEIAALIRQNVTPRVDVALAQAWIRTESIDDPAAIDPNANKAKPNEPEEEAFAHTDIGLGQFDGATLEGMPEFAGKSPSQITAIVEDPHWAVPAFFRYADSLLVRAAAHCAQEPSLLQGCGGDSRRLGIEAYNKGFGESGRGGALAIARRGQYNPDDWKYANLVLRRREQYAAKLGISA
jgi:hypothetical protein